MKQPEGVAFLLGGDFMIIIMVAGLFFFCYGIYNTICYIFMLPTVDAGRNLSEIGTREKISFAYIASILISEAIVRKWDLKWNRADAFEEVLKAKEIYTEGTVYLISRFILFFSGTFWALPMYFVNTIIFWSIILFCILWRLREVFRMIHGKRTDKKKHESKMIDIACKLLPGAFFLVQIIVFTGLFT